MRRQRVIPITYELLVDFLRPRCRANFTSDLPSDLTIVRTFDGRDAPEGFPDYGPCACLVVESSSFDEVPDGEQPPVWTPTYERVA